MTPDLVKKWLIPRLISRNLAIWTVLALEKVVLYCFLVPREMNLRRFCSKSQWQMFLLVSSRHFGAHPDGHQHGQRIRAPVLEGKTKKDMHNLAASRHREHTLLLNRKRVNTGMKRTNSLPLSPVVLTRPYCRENRYLQVLLNTSAKLVSRLFRALQNFFFCFMYKMWQGRQLFAQTFWMQSEYSLESLNFAAFTKPNKHKTESKDFYNSAEFVFEYFDDSQRF